jgi:hypothetical protein
MKLDVRAAALAAGSIAALAYALCTVFCAVTPESVVVYLGTAFFHVDLTGLYRQMTWGTFVIGILEATVGTGIMIAATAWLYNRLARMDVEKPLSAKQGEFPAGGTAL